MASSISLGSREGCVVDRALTEQVPLGIDDIDMGRLLGVVEPPDLARRIEEHGRGRGPLYSF